MMFMMMQECKGQNRVIGGEVHHYNLAFKENIESFDPLLSVDETSGIVLNLIHRNLYTTDTHGNFVKDLAENIFISGNQVYVLLKSGVFFNDSEKFEVTADDVAFSLERLKNSGRQPWILDNVESIEVYNRYTIFFTLKKGGVNEWTRQTYLLSLPQCSIYSKDLFQKYKKFAGASEFRVSHFDAQGLELSSTSGVRLNYQVLPAESGRWFYYQRSKLDMYEAEGIYQYMPNEKEGFKLVTLSQPIVFYGAIVADQESILNKREFRKAINYRMNRKSLTQNVLLGSYQPADYPVPDILGRHMEPLYEYSKNYPCFAGKSDEVVQIYSLSDRDRQLTAKVIQGVLSECGIRSKIKVTDLPTLLRFNNDRKQGIYLLKWIADYPHSENFIIPLFHGKNAGSGGNRSFYHNSTIDYILDHESVNFENLDKIQEIIRDDAPWIFIGFSQKTYYVNEKKPLSIPPIYTGWNEDAFGIIQ